MCSLFILIRVSFLIYFDSLHQTDSGSLSISDSMLERKVKVSHHCGVGGLSASVIQLRFLSFWTIQEKDGILKIFRSL